jgi:ABC-type transport system involved in multi-copper enzyme maturation permease subunit
MAAGNSEPRWYQVGPHGYYDLVRLARRGRSALVRVGYLLTLFAVLAAVYFQTPTEQSINANALIAERFSFTILVMQNLAVLVLVPIYVSASIHEERDKRTLPILFTTHLTAREIVLGKWLACVGQVGMVLLGGLPVLSFVQLWGGIDMALIAANFCVTAGWLVSIGAFSAMTATASRTLARAIVKTYLIVGGMLLSATCCCCVPFCFHNDLPSGVPFLLRPSGGPSGYLVMWLIVGFLAIFQVWGTLLFLARTTTNLEAERGSDPAAPDFFEPEIAALTDKRYPVLPPIEENAVAWKERHMGARSWGYLPLLELPYILCMVVVHIMMRTAGAAAPNADPREFQAVFAVAALGNFAIFLVTLTWRLTGCIVSERDRQTLDALLLLPMPAHGLLLAKFWGNVLRGWQWLAPMGICALIMFSASSPEIALLILFAMAAHFWFFTGLAMFLSVVCRSTLTAYVNLGIVMAMIFVTTAFGKMFYGWIDPAWLTTGVNPVGCWLALTTWREGTPLFHGIMPCLLGYLQAAAVLWPLAWRRFAQRR